MFAIEDLIGLGVWDSARLFGGLGLVKLVLDLGRLGVDVVDRSYLVAACLCFKSLYKQLFIV
jgi:hypothetical protein